MSRKHKPMISAAPCSSHPEAEAEVRIFSPAVRSSLRRGNPTRKQTARKPIISIEGHDVDSIPEKPDRAA